MNSVMFKFNASVHSIATGKEKNLATFYIMNTHPNRNGWGVTEVALKQALPTLIGKTLEIASDHNPDGHSEHTWIQAGKFISIKEEDGYALAVAEITDSKTFEKLASGEIGPISVVITAFDSCCSACGEILPNKQAADTHPCLKKYPNYQLIRSFKFDKVDFVKTPAYPQAGTIKVGAECSTISQPLIYCASVYESQSFKGDNNMSEPEPKTPEQLVQENQKLMETVAALTKELEELKKKIQPPQPPAPAAAPDVAALKEKVAALEMERHEKILCEAVDARFDAGLETNKETARKTLADKPNEYLAALAEDARKVSATLTVIRGTPSVKYTASTTDTLKAAVENRKKELGLNQSFSAMVK